MEMVKKLNRINLAKIFSVIFIIALSVGAVGAGVNFQGVDFNIPDDFNKSGVVRDFNDLGSEGKTCRYINGSNEIIEITVVSDWMGMSLDDLRQDKASSTSLRGHDGWSFKKNNLYCFSYIDGDKGIIVGVSDKALLNQIIV